MGRSLVGTAVEHGTWIGIAAVIAAIGSAAATIIAALNSRTGRRIEEQLTKANGKPNGRHEDGKLHADDPGRSGAEDSGGSG